MGAWSFLDQVEEIRRLVERRKVMDELRKGLTNRALAERFNCSRRTIDYIAREYGFTRPHRP